MIYKNETSKLKSNKLDYLYLLNFQRFIIILKSKIYKYIIILNVITHKKNYYFSFFSCALYAKIKIIPKMRQIPPKTIYEIYKILFFPPKLFKVLRTKYFFP